MKAEFHKIFKIFEELEEAGESATLTISSKGGISSIKLLLESSPSSPSTGTTSTTLPPAPGRRRRHRGAAARARRRQRAAEHQASLLVSPSSASPPPSGEAIDPVGSQSRPLLILPSPSPTSGRRSVSHISGEAASTILWQPQLGWTTPFTSTSNIKQYCLPTQWNLEHWSSSIDKLCA